jgi:hypothetical protein
MPVTLLQRHAEIVMQMWRGRIRRDRLLQRADRLGQLAGLP